MALADIFAKAAQFRWFYVVEATVFTDGPVKGPVDLRLTLWLIRSRFWLARCPA
jgi:hypothetical protein